MNELGGNLARISVVRLNPHGRVYPHIDEGDYYRVRDRYHLVLHSPGGSAMNSGGEDVVFVAGELWWFNNQAVHEAFNPSAEGRIHVIFDVLPGRPAAPFWPASDADHHGASTRTPPGRAVPPAVPAPASRGSAAVNHPVAIDASSSLTAAVRAILAGTTPLPPCPAASLFEPGPGVVHVELRSSGRLVGSRWSQGSDAWENLCRALDALRMEENATGADALMLCVGGLPTAVNILPSRNVL